jgi:uncharacterized damage-inducible protein DinB
MNYKNRLNFIHHLKPQIMNYKNKIVSLVILTATVLASFSFCPVNKPLERKDLMVAAWERAKGYTKEYLDAATEDVYGFKPTPEMRSFGEQMHHLALENYVLTKAALVGVASPSNFKDIEKETFKTKDELTKAVLESYDFVIATIKGLDEAKLGNSVKIFNKFDTTVEDGLNKAFEHQTHHRGQTTVYLRLKGIKPPKEKLF